MVIRTSIRTVLLLLWNRAAPVQQSLFRVLVLSTSSMLLARLIRWGRIHPIRVQIGPQLYHNVTLRNVAHH